MTFLAQALPHDPARNLRSAGLFLDLDPLQGMGELDRGEERELMFIKPGTVLQAFSYTFFLLIHLASL